MSEKLYHFHVFNLYDSLSIKQLTPLYGSRVLFASPTELRVRLEDSTYLFVFRFGAIAFFNASMERIDAERRFLASAMPGGLAEPTEEKYDVLVGSAADKVGLDSTELRHLSVDHLALVGMTVAQSAALAYFERGATRMLAETAEILKRLAKIGRVPIRSRHLLQFIGSAAATRQDILSNLTIVDPPESADVNKHARALFRDLQLHFDHETRLKSLDRKLSLVQDNIEILSDLANSRKSALLEVLVVLLIAVEIALGLFGALK